jgi:hypothetical protein
MFRSFKMVLVSIIPNLPPLMSTAGNHTFRHSTETIDDIGFRNCVWLSVDDTRDSSIPWGIKENNWKIRKSFTPHLRDAGLSMFYTSIVLFFGFSVFMLSSFGGTIALGDWFRWHYCSNAIKI